MAFLCPNLSQLKGFNSKVRQHKASLVNGLVVVLVLLHLFFLTDAPQWRLHVPTLFLTTDHEANLAARVGRDGCVCIFNNWEDLFADFLEVSYEVVMQPDTFS